MTVITHNMLANFSSRQLNITTGEKAKSAEKLGSGYKINRSADDAAGLQISEKMRAQIRGLKKASNNAEEGISLIQTAEGALNEVHSVLQRMNELATQAANDTNTTIDRCAIQQEMDQLKGEINRISKATLFNDRPVLRVPQLVEISGDVYTEAVMNERIAVGLRDGSVAAPYGVGMDFKNVTADRLDELVGKSFSATCSANCNQVFTFSFIADDTETDPINNPGVLANPSKAELNGSDLTITINIKDSDVKDGLGVVNKIISLVTDINDAANIPNPADPSNPIANPFAGYQDGKNLYIGHANGIAANGTQLVMYSIGGGPTYNPGMGLVKASDMFVDEMGIYFQIGATEGQDLEYTIKTISPETLELYDTNVLSHENATKTMTTIQNAITITSTYRAYLGAVQNRLEHTIANLDNTAENTQAAESNIRDTDMAAEMVNLSKSNILAQVGESMLAQANQASQGVLSLLQ